MKIFQAYCQNYIKNLKKDDITLPTNKKARSETYDMLARRYIKGKGAKTLYQICMEYYDESGDFMNPKTLSGHVHSLTKYHKRKVKVPFYKWMIISDVE